MNTQVFVGNLTRDPELKHSADGKPRALFSVAINEGEGDNQKTHFLEFTAFGTLGENVANSLSRGTRVVVSARVDTWKQKVTIDGNEKEITRVSFIASAVGPDLRWATAKVSKVETNRGNDREDDRSSNSSSGSDEGGSRDSGRGSGSGSSGSGSGGNGGSRSSSRGGNESNDF